MRVIVIGGGYAGLACLARLSKVAPDAERHLVDPERWHLRRTLLHETLRKPLKDLRADFGPIARRWDFQHHYARIDWSGKRLAGWSRDRSIRIGKRDYEFDALVVATGLRGGSSRRSRSSNPPLPLEALATGDGVNALKRMVAADEPPWVIGAGASGLQCVFELAAARPEGAPIGLIEADDEVLPTEPKGLRKVVLDRLEELDVDVRLGTRFAGAGRGRVRMKRGRKESSERAGGVLLCTGPAGRPIVADAAGRVCGENGVLPGIFAAGDCARWKDVPFDAATAQTAVRKGRHVAESIARLAEGEQPEDWNARQLGFFLSLGPGDAVGWMFSRAALINGLPAVAAREAVEVRWDLLLRGVDSFTAF